jgi:Lon protease-like protein
VSDALDRVRAATKRLKVFPLPAVVLFPGTAVPLHVFEPRYRELVEAALASDRVFALAQVLPGQEGQLAGTPTLEPMLCVGVIGPHERLEDGRFHLMLAGVARARVVRELPQVHAFREVEAELLEDGEVDRHYEEPVRQALLELLARLPLETGEGLAAVTARARGGALADLVAASLLPDVARRFEVLNTVDGVARLRLVADELLMILAGLGPREPDGFLN